MMPLVTKRLVSSGRVVMLATCEDCGAPAPFVDTSGKVVVAYCGMRDGKFVCKGKTPASPESEIEAA